MLQTIINDVLLIGAIFGLNKIPFFAFVAKNKGAIETVAKDAESVIKDVAQFPVVKAVEVELHHKLNNALDDAKKSELGRVAALSLNAFDKVLGELTIDQVKAVKLLIAKTLNDKGIQVTADEIDKALAEAQKASDEIGGNSLIKIANQFSQEQKAIQAPAQQA